MPDQKLPPEPEIDYDPLALHRKAGALFPNWACDPNLLVSTEEAAAMLNVAHGALGKWRLNRVGPPWIKLPGRTVALSIIRYRYGDIIAFIWHHRQLAKDHPWMANKHNIPTTLLEHFNAQAREAQAQYQPLKRRLHLTHVTEREAQPNSSYPRV
jgi:hypothetical protein